MMSPVLQGVLDSTVPACVHCGMERAFRIASCREISISMRSDRHPEQHPVSPSLVLECFRCRKRCTVTIGIRRAAPEGKFADSLPGLLDGVVALDMTT